MDGEGYHASSNPVTHADLLISNLSRSTQPIRVERSSSGRGGSRRPEHHAGASFQESSDHLISFSPQTSPSSESSELTPFSSRFTSTTSVEVDLEDSSREDLHGHLLGGTPDGNPGSGKALNARETWQRVKHAPLRRSELSGGDAVMAEQGSSVGHSFRFARGRDEQEDNRNMSGIRSGQKLGERVQSRNGQESNWNGTDVPAGNAGQVHQADLMLAYPNGNGSMLIGATQPHLDNSEDAARQRAEVYVQSALPMDDQYPRRVAVSGVENEEGGWVEKRVRRSSIDLSGTPPKPFGGAPAEVGTLQPARSLSTAKHRRGSSHSDDGSAKVKFLCSHGGDLTFTNDKLRYVGGETRIFTVARDIPYSELMFKLTEYYSESLSLKYQLPGAPDLETLLTVSNDEDLNSMMEEYDEIERRNAAEGRMQRLRLFLFPAEVKEGLRLHYDDGGAFTEKHFGMEDPVSQADLRSVYQVDDVDLRPGTGSHYSHYGPSGAEMLLLDPKGHSQQHYPLALHDMVGNHPPLPHVHLPHAGALHHMPSFSHASSPRRSPTDTPVMGPADASGAHPGAFPRLDLPLLSPEQLQQMQQQRFPPPFAAAQHPNAQEDHWQTQHHQGDHARQDLPPVHPTRHSPPATTGEAGMSRVRSRDNLSRFGELAGMDGQPLSANSSPRYDDQMFSAFGEGYPSHQLPPRPPSGGQAGRLGQHTQSESALDMGEGQFGGRLPQAPSMPLLHGHPKPQLHPDPASPRHGMGYFKKVSGVGDFDMSSAPPRDPPRYPRRQPAVEGSSPPMGDTTHGPPPPLQIDAFRRQHSQHPRSLPGSPRQTAYREVPQEMWPPDQMMSRFAQHGTSEGVMRGNAAEQAVGSSSPGAQGYRGRGGEGVYRWAGDPGFRRPEHGGEGEQATPAYLEQEHRERMYEGGQGGHGSGWRGMDPGSDVQYGDPSVRMHRSPSQHAGESLWQASGLMWGADAGEDAPSGWAEQADRERELRQDSGARDGLPGLRVPWEGHSEEHAEGVEQRRLGVGWAQEAGRGSMRRRGSNHDLYREGGDSGQQGRYGPEDAHPGAGPLLQRRTSRRELLAPLALPQSAAAAAAWQGTAGEQQEQTHQKTGQQPHVPTALPLPPTGFQPSDSYPALGETPPPGPDFLRPTQGPSSQPWSRPHPASPNQSGAPLTTADPDPHSLAAATRPEGAVPLGMSFDSPTTTTTNGDVSSSLGTMAGRGGKPVYLPSPAKPSPIPALPALATAGVASSGPQTVVVDASLLGPSTLGVTRPSPVSILQQVEATAAVPTPLIFDAFSAPLGSPAAPLESVLSMDPEFGIPSLAPRLPPAAPTLPTIAPISETTTAELVPLFRASSPQSPPHVVHSDMGAAWTAALAASESPPRSYGEAADWVTKQLVEDMAAAVLQSPLKKKEQEAPATHGSRQLRMGAGEKPAVSIAPLRILEPEWGSAGLKMLANGATGRGSTGTHAQGDYPSSRAEAKHAKHEDAALVVPVSKGPGFVAIHPEDQKLVSPSVQERVLQDQRLPSVVATTGPDSSAPVDAPPSSIPAPADPTTEHTSQEPVEAAQPAVPSPRAVVVERVFGSGSQEGGEDGRGAVRSRDGSLHSEQLRLVDDQIRFQSQSQLLSEAPSAHSPNASAAERLTGAGLSAAQAEKEAKYAGLQEIFDGDLEEIRELGSGTFGTVHYGKWRGTDVAIKRLKASVFSGGDDEDKTDVKILSGDISLSGDLPVEVKRRQNKEIADFWKEAELLSSLHHPNVVAFYGVVKEQGKPVATVTEYMVNGSLKQVLQKKDRTIDRKKRILIAMDASFGMEYLHSKHIVHFDLKCDNLLVNMRDPQRPVCKVGDLGLSKIKKKTMCSGGVRGTLPWMAPELLDGNSHFVTEKVDVFSFGIVLWELLTGEEPYHDLHHGAIIGGIVNNTLRPTIPVWCDPAWRALMERCWAQDQKARPAFKEISDELRAMFAQLSKPSKP